ncbi:hypothetical protein RsTz2092_10400 [Deferribacterales bacterium RsTz2092]|nr:hypothetical protein AGMMS49941_08460 [Deferribacterales bacterium]
MTRLRSLLATNMKACRAQLGYSQAKLADRVDTSTNYIALIEKEKRFPTDSMLEKIAEALDREPYELFALTPIQQDWQEKLITDMIYFLQGRLNKLRE